MIAFIHIEKTAGNTVTGLLRRSFGTRHCDVRIWRRRPAEPFPRVTRYDMRCSRWIHWRMESIAGHLVAPVPDLDDQDVWYFAFLRDPIVRCASHYQFQVRQLGRDISFDDWIANPGYHNLQSRKLAGSPCAERAIELLQRRRIAFVGLVERFDPSLVMLRRECPLRNLDVRYRPTNVAQDNSIKHGLLNDDRHRRRLLDANREDSLLYEHVRRFIFPEQCRRYGDGLEDDARRLRAECLAGVKTRDPFTAQAVRHLVYRPLARLASGSWWY